MRAIIPAHAEVVRDVEHVATTAQAAGLEPVLVLQAWDERLPTCPGLGAEEWTTLADPMPLGKGGAVQWAAATLLGDDEPFVVLDADQPNLTAQVVRAAADHAHAGDWARPTHPTPGPLAHRVARTLDALAIDYPPVLADGGLLAAVAGYPHPRHALATPVTGYGFDLDLALRHYADPTGMLALFDAGPREPRPLDPDHLDLLLREHLAVIASWVTWRECDLTARPHRRAVLQVVPG